MESTLGILTKGYSYFKDKFDEQKTDIIQTRLLFKKTIAIKGEEAAKLFYDREKFKRKGATPARFKKTLFGKGGVQGLDDKAHINRKEMFMQVMDQESLNELNEYFKIYWEIAFQKWKTSNTIIFFEEVENILNLAACKWVGVPLPDDKVKKRTKLLSAMIDGAGGIGIRHYKARYARRKMEKWIQVLVEYIRQEKENTENSIISRFSFYKDTNGKLLPKRIVAVEILNLLRPIVAIARYITFSALALHHYPQYREKLIKDRKGLNKQFVQEVRRFYPFFPFVPAKVKTPFDWKGVRFPKNRRVLLDLYATNHDPKIWKNPERFYPERFQNWSGSPFNFIPQGGGDHFLNHRCAGEWITIQLTQTAVGFLVNNMHYTVPPQDLSIKMGRIPAIPNSKFKVKIHNGATFNEPWYE